MIFKRVLDLAGLLKHKSILLLGPRQTGKSTLCQETLSAAYTVNLMESDAFREYSANPELLRERLPAECQVLVVDEAQRVPELFNEVQVLLDRNPRLRVVLTGSSARKFKRGHINLLPGRVWQRTLHPLVWPEIPVELRGERLIRGSLPAIIQSEMFREELRNYVGLYLEQEIKAEALVRSIGNFSRFLNVVALSNGEVINYSKIAQDAEVKLNTVRNYFQILSDTLVGHILEPYRKTPSRKAVASSKFYLFDLGVTNQLLNRYELVPGTSAYGRALEHMILLEIKAYIDYVGLSLPVFFWRTHSRLEVDFIVGDSVAIEVKSTDKIKYADLKGMKALSDDMKLKRKIIVCREKVRRVMDGGIEIVPVDEFLEELWAGVLFR
ncbi:MAG: ATP-binding protein [Candidatus Dadabacteria bacterium]|nr:MAG: ATP-binding protein [Candidatus Dadabacteria bacterium]